MSNNSPTPSTASLSELSANLAALGEQVAAIGQQVEVQGAIQLEVVKLLQNIHGQQQAFPDRMFQVVNTCLEHRQKDGPSNFKDVLRQLDAMLQNMTADIHMVKQVANLTLREQPSTEKKIRAVFIVQSIPMWDALADVYWAMTRDERFDPMVVSINHSHLGRGEFTGEKDVHAGLTQLGIEHLRLDVPGTEALDILRNLQPDVVFRQQQWDGPVPAGLRTYDISFARICVVPYAVGVLAHEDQKDNMAGYATDHDQPFHRMAWKVFCETELTQSYYRSFNHSDPDKFIFSGYPKYDKLLECRGKGVWPLAEPKGKTYRIVWAPHHSIAVHGKGFGVFDRVYRQMLDWARHAEDLQFVFKPHPALAHAVVERKIMTAEEYRQFLDNWSSLPNAGICDGTYGELFEASDILLTDGISFLLEYHLFDKPLIFIDSKQHQAFNELGQIMERSAHHVTTFEEMKQAVLAYKSGQPWPFAREREELLKVLRPNRQPASQIILDSIASDIINPNSGKNDA